MVKCGVVCGVVVMWDEEKKVDCVSIVDSGVSVDFCRWCWCVIL